MADRAPAHQFTVDGQSVTGAVYRKWSGFALDAKPSTIVNTSWMRPFSTFSGSASMRRVMAYDGEIGGEHPS